MRHFLSFRVNTLFGSSETWLMVLAGIFYACSLSIYPDAGYSAHWLERQLSDTMIWPSVHPVCGVLARLLDMIFPRFVYASAGLLNAVLALLNVALVACLVRRFPIYASTSETRADLSSLAALCAVGMLVIAPGFWWSATRPGPGMVSLTILLGTVLLIDRWIKSRHGRDLAAASFLLGIGAIESPFLALISPIIALVVIALVVNDRAQRSKLPVFVMSGLVGAVLALGVLSFFWRPVYPGEAWFSAMTQTWKTEWMSCLFPSGWMAVAAIVVPVALLGFRAALTPAKHPRRRTRWIQRILVAALVLLFFVNPFSSEHLRTSGTPLLIPWVILSLTFGFSAAFVVRPLVEKMSARQHFVRAVIMGLALTGGVMRFPALNARESDVFQVVWDAVISGLHENDWIISEGRMDAPLWLTARQQNVHPLFIHPALEHHIRYRALLARQLLLPRYQSMAGVGTGALIAERLKESPGGRQEIIALEYYHPLVLAGFQPIPNLTQYEAFPVNAPPDFDERLRRHRDFWMSCEEPLRTLSEKTNANGQYARMLRRHLSRLANDLGVALDHHGRSNKAQTCYQQALTFNPDNLSARINMTAENSPDDLPAELIGSIKARCGADLMSGLARQDGLIFRHATRQWLDDLCRWNEMQTTFDSRLLPVIHQFLAGHTNEAFASVQSLATEPSASREVWILNATMAWERNDSNTVNAAIEQMNRQDEKWAPLLIMLGERAMTSEKYNDAVQYLEQAHKQWPLNTRVLELLIKLYLHMDQETDLDRQLRWLLSIDPWNPWANFVLGLKHVREHQPVPAESALLTAISRQPLPVACNNLAWLLLEQDRKQEALFYVRQAINLEPYGAAQWDTLSSVLMAMEEWKAAGTALDTALTLDPTSTASAVHYRFWRHHTGGVLPHGETALAVFDESKVPVSGRLRQLWEKSVSDTNVGTHHE
jgi:tetratricopeptide (TPR) repeat protein